MDNDAVIRSRISDRLLQLVDEGSSAVVDLQVVLASDLPRERIDQIAKQLTRLGSTRPLTTLGLIILAAPVSAAGAISDVDGVTWVDLQSEVSLDELMD